MFYFLYLYLIMYFQNMEVTFSLDDAGANHVPGVRILRGATPNIEGQTSV